MTEQHPRADAPQPAPAAPAARVEPAERAENGASGRPKAPFRDRSAPAAPARRRPWLGRRHAALLAAGAGLAVLGLATLLVVFVGLVTSTLRTGLGDESSCVAAATAGEAGAAVSTSVLPPRAVCTWTVDGRTAETVLAEGPTAVAGVATGAVAVGVLLVAGTSVAAWRARRAESAPA
ncbi:hypothetical protein [Cellulomonas pakistanensis]|uniref:Uncharacterized protein n=1 Tax=Cellulomonas pakistanensis TaxID=992287 RepID=A0A919U7I3_9CELL|nr:hypothetical protein [Cellulomonas pakistanensis]GIG38034.1 hypothetical protein Cpa01nite_34150 [Cellulomonas pakistanensis]